MRTTIIFLLSILWILRVNSQTQQNDSLEIIKYFPNGKVSVDFWVKLFGNDTLYDGQLIHYYDDSNIYEKMFLKKGKIVGIREIYDKKGRTIFKYTYIEGDFPRKIISQAYYFDFLAACTYSEGTLLETGHGFNDFQQHGITKFFRRNGSLMDSVIFEHNVMKYSARFNSKGKLIYDTKY